MENTKANRERIRMFDQNVQLLLNSSDCEKLFGLVHFNPGVQIIIMFDDNSTMLYIVRFRALERYQKEYKLSKFTKILKDLLDTPSKHELYRNLRVFIPPHQLTKYEQHVQKATSSRTKSQSLLDVSRPKLYNHEDEPQTRDATAFSSVFQTSPNLRTKPALYYSGNDILRDSTG